MVENSFESFVTYFVLIFNAIHLILCSILIQTTNTINVIIGLITLPLPLTSLYGIMSENLRILKTYFLMLIILIVSTIVLTIHMIIRASKSKTRCVSGEVVTSCTPTNASLNHYLQTYGISILICVLVLSIEVIVAICTYFYIKFIKLALFRRDYINI
jgi:hypothetical protein